MLTLYDAPFTTGQAAYVEVNPQQAPGKQAIYVQVILPLGAGMSVFAMVDTGAPHCIFETAYSEALNLSSEAGETVSLRTPYGIYEGSIHRMTIRLAAEQGDSLDIDASVFVPDGEWGFGNFLGYTGVPRASAVCRRSCDQYILFWCL